MFLVREVTMHFVVLQNLLSVQTRPIHLLQDRHVFRWSSNWRLLNDVAIKVTSQASALFAACFVSSASHKFANALFVHGPKHFFSYTHVFSKQMHLILENFATLVSVCSLQPFLIFKFRTVTSIWISFCFANIFWNKIPCIKEIFKYRSQFGGKHPRSRD
jgi:hypothetical protein